MSLAGNGSRLTAITRELAADWGQTRMVWRDAKAAEFELHYLAELFGSVDKAVAVIEQLDKVLAKVRKDCE